MSSLLVALDIAERFMLQQLRIRGKHVYPVSPSYPVKERLRQAIIDNCCWNAPIGINRETRNSETFKELFERIYDEPLLRNQPRTPNDQAQSHTGQR